MDDFPHPSFLPTEYCSVSLHKNWSFSLKISSVNVTKSAVSCRFDHIYGRNPEKKTSFFVQCIWPQAFMIFNFFMPPFLSISIIYGSINHCLDLDNATCFIIIFSTGIFKNSIMYPFTTDKIPELGSTFPFVEMS